MPTSHLTDQQRDIVSHVSTSTGLTLVSAVAGSGKTTLLKAIADSVPHDNSLYISYNSSLANEAKRKFPSSVDCRTSHSLAYQSTVKPFKLSVGFFGPKQVTEDLPYDVRYDFCESLRAFCLSTHLTWDDYYTEHKLPDYYLPMGHKYLDLMHSGKIDCTHDYYLKLFHLLLANGDITYSKPFDLLLWDECLSGDSKVKLEGGKARTIKSLVADYDNHKPLPKAKSFNTATGQYEYKPITAAKCMGTKPTYTVSTEGLTKLICTDNHKLYTQRGYVEVRDIVIGQDYVIQDNTHNQKCKYLLSDLQLQVVLGSYLGDGCLSKQSDFNTYRLSITHGIDQLPYLQDKLKAFPPIAIHNIASGYTGDHTIYQSNATPTFILPDSPFNLVLTSLDSKGLAIWLMDDGSMQSNGTITIHSNSFTLEQNQLLADMLYSRFNLKASVYKSRDYYELHFNAVEASKLLSLTSPYIHPVFHSKFNIHSTHNFDWSSDFLPYGGNFISSIEYHSDQPTYDITVADNHNFFTVRSSGDSSGILVHNCQDMAPVASAIFELLPATRKIGVGDKFQAIYSFNHTVNYFDICPKSTLVFYMTQSFRVPSSIAKYIDKFAKTYLDPAMHFEGVDIQRQPSTRAYISRTNASLISKMIELNSMGVQYTLLRKPDDIFRLPLIICSLRYKGFISSPEYKHLQADFNTWYESRELKLEYRSPLSYLLALYSTDLQLKTAVNLVVRYGKPTIIQAYETAKSHLKAKSNYTLCTSHSSKGLEWDEVTLAPDMNDSIADIIAAIQYGKPLDQLTVEEREALNLYYVSCSRAMVSLHNAIHLAPAKRLQPSPTNSSSYDAAALQELF